MSDLVAGHAYRPAPPDWDWGDHCTWFDTTPPVPLHPVMCHQPERCHASGPERDDDVRSLMQGFAAARKPGCPYGSPPGCRCANCYQPEGAGNE